MVLKLTCIVYFYWRRQWHPTAVLLPGKSHGWRSLIGCSPWGPKELDTTERLHFHFSLSCIGEGNGNPLQCSCWGNARGGGAWWAAVSGVAQSRTRLSDSAAAAAVYFYRPFLALKNFIHFFLADSQIWKLDAYAYINPNKNISWSPNTF